MVSQARSRSRSLACTAPTHPVRPCARSIVSIQPMMASYCMTKTFALVADTAFMLAHSEHRSIHNKAHLVRAAKWTNARSVLVDQKTI